MEQPKHYNRAFSIIELLLVMAVLTILAIVSISVWRNNTNRIIFEQAKKDVLLALEKARSRAETGFQMDPNSKCHEVSVSGTMLTLAEKCGSNCENNCGDSLNVYLPAAVISNPSVFPIPFKRLTGESADKSITISYGGRTSTIKVKPDGAIYEAVP